MEGSPTPLPISLHRTWGTLALALFGRCIFPLVLVCVRATPNEQRAYRLWSVLCGHVYKKYNIHICGGQEKQDHFSSLDSSFDNKVRAAKSKNQKI